MANQHTSPWTEELDEFLLERAGHQPLAAIAKRLGRSEYALQRRLERLQSSDKHALSGTYTAHQLAQALHIDSKVVVKWIKEKGLPASRGDHYTTKDDHADLRYRPYFISPDVFWKWASSNRESLLWHRVPKNALPPEPHWVDEQRKIDYHKGPKARLKWTSDEDHSLWYYYYEKGKTQKEIASLMGRSVSSIEKRLARLRKERMNAS